MAGPIVGVGGGRSWIGLAGPQRTERGGFSLPLRESDAAPSFGRTLQEALGQVSALQDRARDAISAFLRGEPVEVHQVMAAAEEAGIALEMLIEVRNKLMEAYRTVMNMQT